MLHGNIPCSHSSKTSHLRSNNYLIKKRYLEFLDNISVVGNTESLFESDEDLHLPSQAASVSHQIAFGERAGQTVRRLKSQTSLWPSEARYEIKSDGCVTLGGYSVHAATAVKAHEQRKARKACALYGATRTGR